MSGCGRKHRAKHLTRRYLDVNAWDGPKAGEGLGVCMESPHGQHLRVLLFSTDTSDPSVISGPTEQLVMLPGRFHKVIWLSIRDVVVVVGGAVDFKPSPEQLAAFLKDPANAVWREKIEAAQVTTEEQRRGMERAPMFGGTTATTTSLLPTGEEMMERQRMAKAATAAAAAPVSASPAPDGEEEGSRQGPPQNDADALSGVEKREEEDEDDDDDDTDSLDGLVNMNRQNIKHRAQFFSNIAEDEEEEEEEEV